MGSIFFYLINSLQCLSPDTMVNLHGSRRVYRHSSGIMPENSQLQDAGDHCFVPHVPDCHSDSGRIRAYVCCMTLCCEYGSLQGCCGGGKKCSLPVLSWADVQNPAASGVSSQVKPWSVGMQWFLPVISQENGKTQQAAGCSTRLGTSLSLSAVERIFGAFSCLC